MSQLRTEVDAGPNTTAVRSILNADPVWSAYALADLQPDFAPYCRWSVVQAETRAEAGLVLLYTGLEPPVIFTAGAAQQVAAALSESELPPSIYMSAQPEHLPALQAIYDFGADVRPMWRLVLADPAALPILDEALLTRLSTPDSARLRTLYGHGGPFTPDAFDPYQIKNGLFWGITDPDGQLAAAGGTHIVDWKAGVAAIGNMYTHPAHRGRGYAGAILTAIVRQLLSHDVNLIVLNVDQRNIAARRLYERHGFVVHCAFFEGIGARRAG
jgi:RimJ/RimL family protein N-acetyltransferase